jgi:SAM-dependent methyltransferase
VDLKEQQKRFHARADEKRHVNRLRNPFIRPKETLLAQKILAFMPAAGGRLLEIGCGEGSNLLYLNEPRPEVRLVGLDFAREKLTLIASGSGAIQAVCADATRLPFAPRVFDVILIRDLLHHVNWARREVLAEASHLLRAGGSMVVMESNPRTLLNRVYRLVQPVEAGMEDSTPENLLSLGKQFGAVELHYLEASFLVRAVAYFVGWPEKPLRFLVWPLYALASIWETLVQHLRPVRTWSYLMMVVKRG